MASLEILIEQIVPKILAEQQQPVVKTASAVKWVSTQQFCKALAITRQTLQNWNRQVTCIT